MKDNDNNYNSILNGIELTKQNRLTENFKTLLAQYLAVESYEKTLSFLLEEIIENYDKFIVTDYSKEENQILEQRTLILNLNKKYKSNSK